MTFVGNNDILVTKKITGRVMRVLDDQAQDNPLTYLWLQKSNVDY
jgi:hypothetical protein